MTLYDKLLNLPLLQGLSYDDLSDVVAHSKFNFIKRGRDETIVAEGAPASHLIFVLRGSVMVSHRAADGSYSVMEELHGPLMLGLDRLFGFEQTHSGEIRSLTNCSLLMLSKPDVLQLADKYFIVRINIMNRLATNAQKLEATVWQRYPDTILHRMQRFFRIHCLYPAGRKVFRIKMQVLADEVHESRIKVSRQLNSWQRSGLIVLGRERIEIPRLDALLQLKDDD